jgi:hypothetical protein
LERREGVARPEFQASGGVSFWSVELVIAVDRVCRWFFRCGRNRFVPGRHLTDHQMRLYMKFRQTDAPPVVAAKASISAATAYRFEHDRRLPSNWLRVSQGR